MSELENLQTHTLPMVTPEDGDVSRLFRGTETAQYAVGPAALSAALAGLGVGAISEPTINRTGGTAAFTPFSVLPSWGLFVSGQFFVVGQSVSAVRLVADSEMNDVVLPVDAATISIEGIYGVRGDLDLKNDIPPLTSFAMPDLTAVGGSLTVDSDDGLTEVSLLVEVVARDFKVLTSDGVETISAANLALIGRELEINQLPALTAVNLSALVRAGMIGLENCAALATIDLSALTTVDTSFDQDTSALIVLDLSALETVGTNFAVANNNPALATINISALVSVGTFLVVNSCAALTSINASALADVGEGIDLSSNAALTTVTLTSALRSVGGDLTAVDCALSEASVDNVLVRLAALNGTGGTTTYDNHAVDLSGGTNAIPSATGLTAKVTLEGRGNTVTVNS